MTRSSPVRLPVRRPLAAAAVALALAAPGLAAAQAATIDLGDPSVMSQRGQRLALALPYGSSPGERVSVSRFEVVSVKAPDGCGVYACALGGPQGNTLLLCAAPDFSDVNRRAANEAVLYVEEVKVPRGQGLP